MKDKGFTLLPGQSVRLEPSIQVLRRNPKRWQFWKPYTWSAPTSESGGDL